MGNSYPFDTALKAQFKELPFILLRQLITKKLEAVGHSFSAAEVGDLVRCVMRGEVGPFKLSDKKGGEELVDLQIDITESDLADLTAKAEKFLKGDIQSFILSSTREATKMAVKSTLKEWKSRRVSEEIDRIVFSKNLSHRWGEGLDGMRLLLSFVLEFSTKRYAQFRTSRAKKDRRLRELMIRFHARGCRVTAEIITLLEGGFADGAMARWRTLHEINVIAAVIAEYGEEIAERYFAFKSIELKKSADEYDTCAPILQYKPISKKERKLINQNYESAISIYGQSFRYEYGWASYHLGIKRPNFRQLEEVANSSELRSHYKWASQTIHAGPQGAFQSLGMLIGDDPLPGASNAGLQEAGQVTALTIVNLSLLLAPRR